MGSGAGAWGPALHWMDGWIGWIDALVDIIDMDRADRASYLCAYPLFAWAGSGFRGTVRWEPGSGWVDTLQHCTVQHHCIGRLG
jgi:hypothetical protein